MIISASYRTDIPTFYAPWLMNRLRAGYCGVINPYNGRPSRVSLEPADVDGLVLWTKNLGPLWPSLPEIRQRGYGFVVQYSINGYPRELEHRVTDARRAAAHMHQLRELYGPRAAVWRYDPILTTSLTPPAFHVENFGQLAQALRGAGDEVVVSFAQLYAKTNRHLKQAACQNHLTYSDPSPQEKKDLLRQLLPIAQGNGFGLTLCSQRELLIDGVGDARCIDPARMSDVAGRAILAGEKPHRPACGCAQSRDIGQYDTCPHGCIYCYAVNNPARAQERYRNHDPDGEFLYSR